MRSRFVRLIVVFLCVGLLVAGALPAFAATSSTFAGTLSATDPQFSRFVGDYLNGACTGVIPPGYSFHYVSFHVEVTASGDYTLNDIGWLDSDATTIDAYIALFPTGGFNPSSAGNNCLVANDDIGTFNLATGVYTMVVTSYDFGITGPYIFEITGPGQILLVGPAPNLSDGRINNWDPAAPVVLYGTDFSDERGLIGYSSSVPGQVVFEVSASDIAAVPECPAENTLIAQTGAIVLYRLSSCEFELHAPSVDGAKTYVVQFSGLYPGAFTHSSEN